MLSDKKTVIYMIEFYPELSQTFIFEEIRSLRDNGWEVDILGLNEPLKHRSSLPEAYGFADRATRPSSRPDRKLGRALGLARDLLYLAARGKLGGVLKLLSYIDPFVLTNRGDLARYAVALNSISGADRHLLVCHFGPMGLMAARIKALGLADIQILTVFHGYDLTSFLKDRPDGVYADLFREGNCMVPISAFWRERLSNLGAPADKIQVVRLGVNVEAFEYTERKRDRGEPLRIISVGRLCDKKGHRYLVTAIAELLKRRPDLPVHLDLAGDGELREDVAAQISDLGLESVITLHGAIQNSRVSELLRAANVFALHSVIADDGDMEGIPVSIMEAMATGLPVVSTLHSGIPELVENGGSGFLVPERDSIATSTAIERLADDPELSVSMGRRAREIVVERFNRDTQAKAFIDVLDSQG